MPSPSASMPAVSSPVRCPAAPLDEVNICRRGAISDYGYSELATGTSRSTLPASRGNQLQEADQQRDRASAGSPQKALHTEIASGRSRPVSPHIRV